MSRVFIIAEAGVNHNGSIELAKKLVDAAKFAGVDAIKFQTFKAEKLVSKNAQKADYQKKNTGNADDSQLKMLKALELSYDEFRELKDYCDEQHIIFLSTAFDFESLDFLESIGIPIYKVPSGEITNLPYLERIARTGKEIILSTGMCTLDEVRDAMNVLKENGAENISVLHCTTEYPAPLEEVNLAAMQFMAKELNCSIGYSDHTEGIDVPIAAVALGASIIEKHFTLDKNMEGPDHKASLEPNELKDMVSAIRNVELAIGEQKKEPTESERRNMAIARKSIVASKRINKGDLFTEENLTVKRPGNGISPMKWYEVLGKNAGRDFEEDELIEL